MADDNAQQNIDVTFKFTKTGDGDVTGAYAKLQNQLDQTRKTSDILNKTLADIKKDTDVRELGRFYGELARNIDDSEKAASLLATRLQDIGASTDDIKKAADEFQRMSDAQNNAGGGGNLSGLRRTGSALSQLGASGLGGSLSQIGDVSQVVKEFSEILPDVASGAVAAAGGLAPFVAVLAPIAGIVALAAAGQSEYNQKLKESHDAFALVIADSQKQTDLQISNITAARNTTSAQNLQNAQDQQAAFDLQNQHITDLQKQKAAIDAQLNSPGQVLQTLIGNRGSTVALQEGSDQLQKAIEEAVKALGDMQTQEKNTVEVLGPLVDAHQKEVDALAAAKKAQEEHTQALKDAAAEQKKTDAEIEQARKQLITVNEQLADAEKKRSDQLASRVQEDQRAGEISVLEGKISAAQEQEQAQTNADKLTHIRAEGGDAEAQALQKQAERINAINENFFLSQQKALNSYLTSEQRAEQDYSTKRIRQVEDLQNTLLGLASSRDVSGFVNARNAGLTQLSRDADDNGTASARRRQDYETQAREADANRQRQLADLIQSNNQENEQRRAQLNKRVNDEIAAGQGTLKTSQVLQAQLAALRQRYAVEDLAARRANEDSAYTQQIGKLRQRQSDLNAIIGQTLNPAVTLMSQLGNAVVSFITQVRNSVSAPYSSGSHTPMGGYAAGTNYVPRTGVYQLHQGEAVIPAAQNRNYSPSWGRGRGGSNITVNIAGVGSLVSTAELNNTVEMIVGGLERVAGVA